MVSSIQSINYVGLACWPVLVRPPHQSRSMLRGYCTVLNITVPGYIQQEKLPSLLSLAFRKTLEKSKLPVRGYKHNQKTVDRAVFLIVFELVPERKQRGQNAENRRNHKRNGCIAR